MPVYPKPEAEERDFAYQVLQGISRLALFDQLTVPLQFGSIERFVRRQIKVKPIDIKCVGK
jgi:hypothetical protein